MRRPVVIITTTDADNASFVWATQAGNQILCVMPSRGVDSPLYRDAAIEAITQLVKDTNIEPEWPEGWGSDPVAE